ncbi:flagellar biosynthesis protein FlhF, partial [Campylobacter sp. BCW_8712]
IPQEDEDVVLDFSNTRLNRNLNTVKNNDLTKKTYQDFPQNKINPHQNKTLDFDDFKEKLSEVSNEISKVTNTPLENY